MSKGWMLGVGAGLDFGGLGLIVTTLPEAGWPLAAGLALMLAGTMLITRSLQSKSEATADGPAERKRASKRWQPEPELLRDPPRPVSMTVTAKITVVAWLAMLAVAGWFGWQNVWRLAPPVPSQTLILNEGVRATATIHRKEVRDREDGQQRYYLYYNFTDASGSGVRSSTSVSASLFGEYEEGDSLEVAYLPGEPLAHFAVELTRGPFAMRGSLMALVVGAFLLFLLGAKMLRHRNLARSGKAVAGYVESVVRRGGGKKLEVRYETVNGREITIKPLERNALRKQGDVVTVLYLPGNPEDGEMYSLCLFRAVE